MSRHASQIEERLRLAGKPGQAMHRIVVRRGGAAVTALRARVEGKLPDVETFAEPIGGGEWAVYFVASANVDLDFLKPDVIEP